MTRKKLVQESILNINHLIVLYLTEQNNEVKDKQSPFMNCYISLLFFFRVNAMFVFAQLHYAFSNCQERRLREYSCLGNQIAKYKKKPK